MKIEKILNALPSSIKYSNGESGLCIRWSVLHKKWRASYGAYQQLKHTYFSDDPAEALLLLYKQMLKNKNHKNKVQNIFNENTSKI